MKERLNALRNELSPDPEFLNNLEINMQSKLRKRRGRTFKAHSRRQGFSRTALIFTAAGAIVLAVCCARLVPKENPDRLSPAPLAAVSFAPEVSAEQTELAMIAPEVTLPASASLTDQALMRGSYLVGCPSDETIPVRSSENADSETIGTLVSGDFALIGNGEAQNRRADAWQIQWWDESEKRIRTGWIANQDTAIKHMALILSPAKPLAIAGKVRTSGVSLRMGHDADSPQLFALAEGQYVYLIARYENWILASTEPFASEYYQTGDLAAFAIGWLQVADVYGME